MKIDLHVHTKYSFDSSNEPRKIVKVALKKKIDGLAITDHDAFKGALEVEKLSKKKLLIIKGEEVTTENGEVLGFFLQEKVKPGPVEEVVDKIKEQGGLVAVPHPFDSFRSSSFFPSDKDNRFFDLVEVFNARCVRSKFNLLAEKYARKHSKNVTAGSDAHFLFEIGKAYILTQTSDVRKDLLKGKVKVEGKRTVPLVHLATLVKKLI